MAAPGSADVIVDFLRARRLEVRLVADLIPYAANARQHSEQQIDQIVASIRRFGWTNPLLVDGMRIVAGHGRLKAAARLGMLRVPCLELGGLSEDERRALVIADNRIAENAVWDFTILASELRELRMTDMDMNALGFTATDLAELLADQPAEPARFANLADRFLIPPFSVFNAREGWWQDRKRAWIALGIRSEIGRGANTLGFSEVCNKRGHRHAEPGHGGGTRGAWAQFAETRARHAAELSAARGRAMRTDSVGSPGSFISTGAATGTSIFDPVLCEIAYRWFAPPGGLVLDPFAGGSVRGIVAGKLGLRYIGIDLREEQVAANDEQAQAILTVPELLPPALSEQTADPDAITPVEQRGAIWVKRDDLFQCGGARGGKARACLALLRGASGAVAAGNRLSPMVSRVARVAAALGIPCRAHAAGSRALSAEERDAVEHGAEMVKIPGTNYLTAIKARAKADAERLGWVYVPFGLECPEYFEQTRAQVSNLPTEIKRIVLAAGSGMTAAAICAGLRTMGRRDRILAVRVGLDPEPLIDRWAPEDWREQIEIVQAPTDFSIPEARTQWWGIELDPHYEAKAAAYVQPGDLFWNTAVRADSADSADSADFADSADSADFADFADSAPAWARGYDLGKLKALAALFKRHDAGMTQGAFTGVRESSIAEWLAAGELLVLYSPGAEPVAAAVVRRAASAGRIEDFSGATIGESKAGDLHIKRFAGAPGALELLLRDALGTAPRAWLELWQEKAEDRAIAQRLGFTWAGSKIRASSEIVGVWALGVPVRAPSAIEQAGLCCLELPVLNIAPLAQTLGSPAWANHYSSYNKGKTWSAIALRGYGGAPEFIIKPSEMSRKWKAENPEKLAWAIADTPLRAQLPAAEPLIAAIPGEKHRIRLMRLAPLEGELTRHADITDPDAGVAPGRLLRIHIPIKTNPDVIFEQWLLSGEKRTANMGEGEAWYLDTRKPHTAVNRGPAERIHLVIDVESCAALLELLPLQQEAAA